MAVIDDIVEYYREITKWYYHKKLSCLQDKLDRHPYKNFESLCNLSQATSQEYINDLKDISRELDTLRSKVAHKKEDQVNLLYEDIRKGLYTLSEVSHNS